MLYTYFQAEKNGHKGCSAQIFPPENQQDPCNDCGHITDSDQFRIMTH